VEILRITQSGSFTYNTVWQLYVFRAELLIHRYGLNRRLCGSSRQYGGLEKSFDIFVYRIQMADNPAHSLETGN